MDPTEGPAQLRPRSLGEPTPKAGNTSSPALALKRDWIWPVCSYCGRLDDGKPPRGCAVGGCPLGLDC